MKFLGPFSRGLYSNTSVSLQLEASVSLGRNMDPSASLKESMGSDGSMDLGVSICLEASGPPRCMWRLFPLLCAQWVLPFYGVHTPGVVDDGALSMGPF